MNAKTCIGIAAIALAAAVLLGAFAAHALKPDLTAGQSNLFQTGVQYHYYHALGLMLIGLVWLHWPDAGALRWAAWLMVTGLILFCGSLYLMAVTGQRELGRVTPLGGIAFVLAWAVTAWAVLKRPASM